MSEISKQHQANLDYILKELQDKPEATGNFKKIIDFQKKYLLEVEIIFPVMKEVVKSIDFISGWKKDNPIKTNLIEKHWLKNMKHQGKESLSKCPDSYILQHINSDDDYLKKDFQSNLADDSSEFFE